MKRYKNKMEIYPRYKLLGPFSLEYYYANWILVFNKKFLVYYRAKAGAKPLSLCSKGDYLLKSIDSKIEERKSIRNFWEELIG